MTFHGQKMNVLVSDLYSIQLLSVLMKHLVIGQFIFFSLFSLLLIGYHQSANLV